MLTFSSDVKMCFEKSLPLLMCLYHVPMLLRAQFVTRFGLVTLMQYPHSRPVPFPSFHSSKIYHSLLLHDSSWKSHLCLSFNGL